MSVKLHHSYHLVDPSPWPVIGAISVFMTTIGAAMFMHSYLSGLIVLSCGIIMILITMTFWWRDVVRESTLQGLHTFVVQKGLRYGMILFILSEILFFAAFFWAFFSF